MTTLTKQKHEYDDKVSKVIDKVFRKILGDKGALLIYKHLENRYSLRRDEIAEKIDVFAEGLEEFLMSGAHVIEMKILEDVYSSYGLSRRPEFVRGNRYNFVSQIKMLTRQA